MTEGKKLIANSQFAEEFEGVETEKVLFLDRPLAEETWGQYVDPIAKSYFKLPDDNWLVTGTTKSLAHWQEDYNQDKWEKIQGVLDVELDWEDEDRVYFLISRLLVLESNWATFKRYWINFLECDDDCPIVINERRTESALIFRPIGDLVRKDQDPNA